MTTGDYSTKELLQQEEELALSSFTNEDAIGLGQELLKLAFTFLRVRATNKLSVSLKNALSFILL